MRIVALNDALISDVEDLMALGEPYVRARTSSDYWLYSALFSTTCPVALTDDRVVGAIIAMRSQDDPRDVYIQDVMTDPAHRGQGIAAALLQSITVQANVWQCRRIYLTSEPDNHAAAMAWHKVGFINIPGDHVVDGVQVISNFKGRGKDRAVYELTLA
ncbi:GNAT family N-acetyltransferase [Actinoplanes sp. Pm04-4]|uniref:GNAT family N-acetyltransferase n=1 Tax=Paractinoplanes pyxinae TaxID=2997416 RepID=A0ABT4B4Q8_9ACTN|nr:GNAT family N-acetyltransferase [Actinoplanes pyxinae]MCY1141476.1 GNAT family N-acetyltransferase [Actinoplanes pyxinae]